MNYNEKAADNIYQQFLLSIIVRILFVQKFVKVKIFTIFSEQTLTGR